MADKTAQQKEVETTKEVKKAAKPEEETPVEDESKSENGENAKNGEAEEKETPKKSEEKTTTEAADESDKVCSVKRKSTGGGEATEPPSEGVTPEKKAKLAETIEAESNGEAEVAA